MTNQGWEDSLDWYSIKYPFGDHLKAIEINQDEVNDRLVEECVQRYIVAETASGYLITHKDIEKHLEVINDHGMEAYLKKRLELVENE